MVHLKRICFFGVNKRIRSILFFSVLCLALPFITACDYGKKEVVATKSGVPPPFAQTKDVSIDQIREIARPLDSEEDDSITLNDIAMAQTPEKPAFSGFKQNILFQSEALDSNARFARLEEAVQQLSDKISKMDPTLKRLVEIDSDLDQLTSQLEILVKNDNSSGIQTPPIREYQDVRLETPEEDLDKIQPASGDNGDSIEEARKRGTFVIRENPDDIGLSNNLSAIQSIRVADHPTKTRIVFESPDNITINVEMDGKDTLIIEFPDQDISQLVTQSLQRKSSFIQAFETSTKGDALVVSLNQEALKFTQGHLPPSADNPNHRFYVDVVK